MRGAARRLACRIGWQALMGLSLGCASVEAPTRFFAGESVQAVGQPGKPSADQPQGAAPQRSQEISAEGWASAVRGREHITLRLTNRSMATIRLSYAVDEFVARTGDQRTFALAKEDFLRYPTMLEPGDEQTIALVLPQHISAGDLTELSARIDDRRVAVLLKPVEWLAASAGPGGWWHRGRVGPVGGRVAGIVGRSDAMDAALGGGTPPASSAAVPVAVEFWQELGTMLRVDVRWDETQQVATLGHGERRTFALSPGAHRLQIVSRLPPMTESRGVVPVIVAADAVPRVTLDARATLPRVEMRARVWQGESVVFDEVF